MNVLVTMIPNPLIGNQISVIPGQYVILHKCKQYANDESISVLVPKGCINKSILPNPNMERFELDLDMLNEAVEVGRLASNSNKALGTYSNGRLFDKINDNEVVQVKYVTKAEALIKVSIT